jgi:hypothetical protein
MTNDQPVGRWFIDLDWLEQNNRSFLALAQGCLCPKCTERLKKGKKQFLPAEFPPHIKGCCAKAPGFITERMPILESVFRLFLANGNQPLNLEELNQQLSQWRGGYRTSVEVLSRLLRYDQYYGLRPVLETLGR